MSCMGSPPKPWSRSKISGVS